MNLRFTLKLEKKINDLIVEKQEEILKWFQFDEFLCHYLLNFKVQRNRYKGADKSLARP